MNYKKILTEMYDGENVEEYPETGDELSDDVLTDIEDEGYTKLDDEFDDVDDELADIPDIEMGSLVRVLDASSYTAEELDLSPEDFESFKNKVDEGDVAIVFAIDDENPELANIVFEDGLEIFGIPVLSLFDDTDELARPNSPDDVSNEEMDVDFDKE